MTLENGKVMKLKRVDGRYHMWRKKKVSSMEEARISSLTYSNGWLSLECSLFRLLMSKVVGVVEKPS